MNQPHPTTQEHRAKILADLEAVWARAPHQRLGQLLLNADREMLFSVSDVELVARAERWLANIEQLRAEQKARSAAATNFPGAGLDPDPSDVV